MRCPQCGRWNRATLPRCFFCGAALPPEAETPAPESPQPSASVIYAVSQDGTQAVPQPDERDTLAKEMQSFHVRRKRGEAQQQRIRQEGIQGGFTPTTRSVRIETEPARIYTDPQAEDAENDEPEGDVRPGAVPAPHFSRNRIPQYDDIEAPPDYQPLWRDEYRPRPRARGMAQREMRHVQVYGFRRFLPILAVMLIVFAALGAAYQFILLPILNRPPEEPGAQVEIIPSILGDMAAHTVRIPAEEGAQIYIKELRKSYIVTGGYAEITVADYTWSELNNEIEEAQMEVSLTPYIKTSAGEQKLMDVIHYTIDIPLSPLILVSPPSNYLEVSTSPYNIQFQVAQNSTVFINGEDYSSYVNTRDGYISYNALVSPIGNNTIEIVVNCQ